MAQGFTDFSEYTPDAQPSGWVWLWSTEAANVRDSGIPDAALGSQALEIVQGGRSERGAFVWQFNGGPGILGDVDVEVLALLYGGVNDNNALRAGLHIGGVATTENAYLFSANLVSGAATQILGKYVSGTSTNIDSANIDVDGGVPTWVRLKYLASTNTLFCTVWNDGDSEPGAQLSAVDTSLSGGLVGILTVIAGQTTWCGQFGWGTEGDPAPSEPLTVAHEASTSLSGTATQSTAGLKTLNGVTALDGIASLVAAGVTLDLAAVSLDGVATLTAAAEGGSTGVASLLGTASLAADPLLTLQPSVELDGVGVMSASGLRFSRAQTALEGSGTLISAGTLGLGGVTLLTGEAFLVAIGETQFFFTYRIPGGFSDRTPIPGGGTVNTPRIPGGFVT